MLARHAVAVLGLPLDHTDPFDRLLVARTQLEQWVLVNVDEAVTAYDVELLV